MATVVGIFEEYFLNKKLLPVVKPVSQTRRFTHAKDTINRCITTWKRNKNAHYTVASKKSYSITQLAKMFSTKIKYLSERPGESFLSALILKNLNNKIIRLKAKIKLKDYIRDFLIKNKTV